MEGFPCGSELEEACGAQVVMEEACGAQVVMSS